jgi:hypothetical protein
VHDINVDLLTICYLYMDPCYHGVARPLVTDGGDGPQIIRRVAVNILNKLSRRADKRWSFNLVLDEELTTHCHGCYTGPQKAGSCEYGNKPSGSIKRREFLDLLSDY